MSSDKILHRMWFGRHPIPEKYQQYGRRWHELNPEWEVQQHGDELLSEAINSDVVEDLLARDAQRGGVELYVQLADVLGYELALRFGGIVVNMDIEPVRPLSYMYDRYAIGDKAYAATEDDSGVLVNAVLGGPAGHPMWRSVVEALPSRYFSMPGEEMVITTGPRLLTACAEGRDDLVRLPVEAFNQVHWSTIPHGSDAGGLWQETPQVIGVHHWGHRLEGRSNVVETATRGTQ